MTSIYLVRHAEAEGNLFRRAQGQFDGMITSLGHRQVECLRQRFLSVPIDAVYASDLRRTRITSAAIWQPKGLMPSFTPELREYSLGCWENTPWTEWAAQDSESLRRFNQLDGFAPLGGETPDQVRDRMVSAFWRIVKENEGKTVAIVSHGMALRILMGALEGLSFEEMRSAPHSDNTAVSLIEAEGDSARIVFRDDNSHLGELSTFAKQKWWRTADNAPDPALRFRGLEADNREDLAAVMDAARSEGLSPAFDPADHADRIRLGYWQDKVAGVVIPTDDDCWFYLLPALRGNRQGIQLVGEGVDVLRRQGHTRLCCRCASHAQALYLAHYGFDREGLVCSLNIDFGL